MKHTKGPWKASSIEHGVVWCHKLKVAVVDGWTGEEEKANTRLIAAAPELLLALQTALGYLESPPFLHLHGDMPAKKARAAIAKATQS